MSNLAKSTTPNTNQPIVKASSSMQESNNQSGDVSENSDQKREKSTQNSALKIDGFDDVNMLIKITLFVFFTVPVVIFLFIFDYVLPTVGILPKERKDEVVEAAPEAVSCKVKVETGFVSEETVEISSSEEPIEISSNSGETVKISSNSDSDEEDSSDSSEDCDEVYSSQCDEKDIKLVMENANVTRNQAVKALLRNNNQVVEASVELIMKKKL